MNTSSANPSFSNSRWEKLHCDVVPALVQELSKSYRRSCSPESIDFVAREVIDNEVFQGLWDLNPQDPFFGLLTVVKWRMIDWIRKKRTAREAAFRFQGPGLSDRADEAVSPVDQDEVDKLVNFVLNKFVASLNDDERLVLMEHHVAKKSYRIIGYEQGWTMKRVETVKKRVQRKIDKFREEHAEMSSELPR